MPGDDNDTQCEDGPSPFDLDSIPRSTYIADGLTRLNADWITEHISTTVGEQAYDRAWRAIIPQWLGRLSEELRGTYRIDESPEFTILQPASVERPNRLVDHAERSRLLAMRFWPGLAIEQDVFGKHVVIVAESQDDYYDYTSHYYPDGEFGGSGGMCIRGTGYTHMILNASAPYVQELALTHEITHALLAQLPLPLWIEEGMVQIVEENINQNVVPYINAFEHKAYWSEHTLAGLWLGSAFHEEGPGQSLAYQLSRHMVFELAKKDMKRLIAFANEAMQLDAGRAAAIKHLGHSLSGCLPDFLQIKFD